MELCCWARVIILRRKKPQTRPPLRLQANEDLVPAMASSAMPFLDRGQGEVPAHLDGWYALEEGGCRLSWASRCPEATVVAVVQSTPREGS